MELIAIVGVTMAVTLAVRFATDAAHIRRTNARNQALIASAKQRANKPWTIMTTLDRKAETLFGLLDNLRRQPTKVDVVVIVKRTAGTNAAKTLRRFAKEYGLAITIVTHKAGMLPLSVAQTRAKGAFVLVLDPNDRLANNSLKNLGIEFAVQPKIDGLRIPAHTATTHTLLSACVAHSHIATPDLQHIAYRRTKTPRTEPQLETSHLASVLVDPQRTPQTYASALTYFAARTRLTKAVIIVLAAAAIIAALNALPDSTSQLVALMIALACVVITKLLSIVELRVYSPIQLMNIGLVAPLYPVFVFAVAVTKIVTLRHR